MPINMGNVRKDTAEFLDENREWLIRLETLRMAYDPIKYETDQHLEGTRAFLDAAKLLMRFMSEEFDDIDLFAAQLRESIRNE
jgi:hypothetical protein